MLLRNMLAAPTARTAVAAQERRRGAKMEVPCSQSQDRLLADVAALISTGPAVTPVSAKRRRVGTARRVGLRRGSGWARGAAYDDRSIDPKKKMLRRAALLVALCARATKSDEAVPRELRPKHVDARELAGNPYYVEDPVFTNRTTFLGTECSKSVQFALKSRTARSGPRRLPAAGPKLQRRSPRLPNGLERAQM